MVHILAVGAEHRFPDDYKVVRTDKIREHYIFEIQTSDVTLYLSFTNDAVKNDGCSYGKSFLHKIKNTGTEIVIEFLDPAFKIGFHTVWLPHSGCFTFNIDQTLPMSREFSFRRPSGRLTKKAR